MPVHINGCFSPPHPVFNFSWTIRCESGDRNVQWGIEWQGSNHRKNCVCLDVCMSPKPCQWCGPSGGAGHDWGGHCKNSCFWCHQEHAAMLGSWGSARNRYRDQWVWGSRRRTCPHNWATQLLSMEGQGSEEHFQRLALPSRTKLSTTGQRAVALQQHLERAG